MNTNNKEAFWDDLDKLTFLHDWSLKEKSDIVQLFEAYSTVFQDNEDTEIQDRPTFSCSNCKSNSHITLICDKPSSKVEKLKELNSRLSNALEYSTNVKAYWAVDAMKELTQILIEDEE